MEKGGTQNYNTPDLVLPCFTRYAYLMYIRRSTLTGLLASFPGPHNLAWE